MNKELKAIKMDNRDERVHLASTTENAETLAWFAGDLDPLVLLSLVKNPLFDRYMFDRMPFTQQNKKNKDEFWIWTEIMEALLGSKVVTL